MTGKTRVYSYVLFLLIGLASCKGRNAENRVSTEPSERKENKPVEIVEPKMVWVPAGSFQMGSDDPMFPDAQPIHKVTVKGFLMDEHEVTNAEFAQFVDATKYKTI